VEEPSIQPITMTWIVVLFNVALTSVDLVLPSFSRLLFWEKLHRGMGAED